LLFVDNQTIVYFSKDLTFHLKSKHINMRYHYT